MTKHFPAICVKHPNILFWSKEAITRHRRMENCYEEIIGIRSKAYKKWKAKKEKEAQP